MHTGKNKMHQKLSNITYCSALIQYIQEVEMLCRRSFIINFLNSDKNVYQVVFKEFSGYYNEQGLFYCSVCNANEL